MVRIVLVQHSKEGTSTYNLLIRRRIGYAITTTLVYRQWHIHFHNQAQMRKIFVLQDANEKNRGKIGSGNCLLTIANGANNVT